VFGLAKYNYERFTRELLLKQVLSNRFAGPRAGERAPGFTARTLEGAELSLSNFHGKKNVVLTLGSATCTFTAASIAGMNKLHCEYNDKGVQFLFVYVREAHPGERLASHRSMSDKAQAAERFQADEGIEMPVLVDDLRGSIHKRYGKLPNPTYLIDKSGRIAFRCLWTRPSAVESALQELRDRQREREVEHAIVQGGEDAAMPSAFSLLRMHRALDRGGRQATRNFRHEMGISASFAVATGRLLRPVFSSPRRAAGTLAVSAGVAAGGVLLGRYLLMERSGEPRRAEATSLQGSRTPGSNGDEAVGS
jgi:hypothetical protein